MPFISGDDLLDEGMSAPRWIWRRLRRHARWLHTEGFGRLIEEGDLDPIDRIRTGFRKASWRRRHDESPHAVPIFLVGLQRSGTNMVVRGLERSPLVEVYNEKNRAAFRRFRLRPDPVIKELVIRSRHPFVLFKPLCDSHRVGDLLDQLGTPSSGRAIWLVRAVDDRVRSSVEKFGASNLRALRRIAEGRATDLWQSQGLSEASLELIRSFDYDRISAWSASALFWYVRNAILFEQGLHERPDLVVVAYERVLEDPRASIQQLCRFLGIPYEDRFVAHISPSRRMDRPALDIDPEIRRRCDDLGARLETAVERSSAEPAA